MNILYNKKISFILNLNLSLNFVLCLSLSLLYPNLLYGQEAGITSNYIEDKVIENDPDVIFAENFEEGTITAVKARWEKIKTLYIPYPTSHISHLSLVSLTILASCGCGITVEESAGNSSNNSATLTWEAPTKNVDGSDLTTLAGYKILYYGYLRNFFTRNSLKGRTMQHH